MRATPLLVAIIMASTLILSACGTTGALYLPEKQYPQNVPAK